MPISGAVTRKGLTTPLTHRVASIFYLCAGAIYIVLLGSPTGSVTLVSSLSEIPTVAVLHHPFLFGENQRSAKRGSKKDLWCRCRGGLRKRSTYQVPITIPISRITLFAICLSFSSPPLHPCCFIRPLSLSSLSFRSPFFRHDWIKKGWGFSPEF